MRALVIGVTLAALSAPVSAMAQAPTRAVHIGTLTPGARPSAPDWKERSPFYRELQALGWVEGRNLVVEDRWAEGKVARLPALAAELVGLKVDVIVTRSWPAAVAARQASSTIPIVSMNTGDPVATGLVASLARPGGNLTGVTELAVETSAKRLQLLKEAIPRLASVAVLYNPADGGMTLRFRQVQRAGRTLGVTVRPLGVQEPEDFDQAFAALTHERPDALFVVADVLTVFNRKRILDFAAQNRLPAMYEGRGFVDAGGLMSFGPIETVMVQRAAAYVDKILRGARPGDLPIEQPTRFELAVSLRAAKALGLTMPQTILMRADYVIQ